jgi:hypothetical protein
MAVIRANENTQLVKDFASHLLIEPFKENPNFKAAGLIILRDNGSENENKN